MTREATEKFYTSDFRLLHEQDILNPRWRRHLRRSKARGMLDILSKTGHESCRRVGWSFEVGCGTGGQPAGVSRTVGSRLQAATTARRSLEYGRSRGIQGLLLGGVDETGTPATRVPRISSSCRTSSNTSPTIPRELAQVARLMKPGARLFVAVPGIHAIRSSTCAGNIVQYFIISHNYHFSLSRR